MGDTSVKFSRITILVLIIIVAAWPIADAQFEIVGQLELGYEVRNLAVDGFHAYVCSVHRTPDVMYVIDISDSHNPDSISALPLGFSSEGLCVSESLVYLAQQQLGLWIVDVANPASPRVAGVCDSAHFCHDVVTAADRAYTASCYRVCSIDIQDAANPQRDWFENRALELRNIRMGASKIFVISHLLSDYSYTVTMYDIASSDHPALLTVFDEPYDIYDVAAHGDTVYMVCGDSCLRVMDVTDGLNPRLIGSCGIWSGGWKIALMGSVALITSGTRVQIIDISNPAMPSRIALNYYPPINHLVVEGDLIYATGGPGFGWFYILRLVMNAAEDRGADRPTQFAQFANYPDPFNAATNITYELSLASSVRIEVFDIRGRRVEILLDEWKQAGRYRLSWDAAGFGSGVYFCKVTVDSSSKTEKMLLIK
ncbi:MAG: hypothetical protein A2W25_09660 [candidate division Zixibacteria bacterium RBG_16_53_22]|nr:MAG: hypothetical protein A2W25_09660 [candidate division Zixibacteria bacterium RBG_16_53_22]